MASGPMAWCRWSNPNWLIYQRYLIPSIVNFRALKNLIYSRAFPLGSLTRNLSAATAQADVRAGDITMKSKPVSSLLYGILEVLRCSRVMDTRYIWLIPEILPLVRDKAFYRLPISCLHQSLQHSLKYSRLFSSETDEYKISCCMMQSCNIHNLGENQMSAAEIYRQTPTSSSLLHQSIASWSRYRSFEHYCWLCRLEHVSKVRVFLVRKVVKGKCMCDLFIYLGHWGRGCFNRQYRCCSLALCFVATLKKNSKQYKEDVEEHVETEMRGEPFPISRRVASLEDLSMVSNHDSGDTGEWGGIPEAQSYFRQPMLRM